jgi:hypothetical protein
MREVPVALSHDFDRRSCKGDRRRIDIKGVERRRAQDRDGNNGRRAEVDDVLVGLGRQADRTTMVLTLAAASIQQSAS